MTWSRDEIKVAVISYFKLFALPHPNGHQNSKANRYIFKSASGVEIEIMFEKNTDSPPNIWCLSSYIPKNVRDQVAFRESPRCSLSDEKYGRHSALKLLPQLAEQDLIVMTPNSLEEIGSIFDALRNIA